MIALGQLGPGGETTTGTTSGTTTGPTGTTGSTGGSGEYYEVTYEGGKITTYGPRGSEVFDYTLGGDGWYGGGRGFGDDGVTCNGPITVTFTWKGDPSDTPKNVIIIEKCVAKWQAAGTGSCTNHFGDPAIGSFFPNGEEKGKDSTGTPIHHIWVKTDPGTSFSFTRSPEAIAVNSTPHPVISADVRYTSIAIPVLLNLNGTIYQNGIHHVLMGQKVQASIDVFGYQLSNYNWTVPLDVYDSFYISSNQDAGHVVPINSSIWSTASPSWRWKGQEDLNGWIPVECTLTATLPGIWSGSVTARRKVQIYQPQSEYTYNTGSVNYLDNFGKVMAGNDETIPKLHGMDFFGKVATPTLFFLTQGSGQWQFSQLLDIDFNYNKAGVPGHVGTTGYELDGAWKYDNSSPWPAVSSTQSTNDSPNAPLNRITSYVIALDAYMYQMYCPPNNGNGIDWVPAYRLNWDWDAYGSRATLADPFSPIPPGDVSAIDLESFPPFPSWTHIFPGVVVP